MAAAMKRRWRLFWAWQVFEALNLYLALLWKLGSRRAEDPWWWWLWMWYVYVGRNSPPNAPWEIAHLHYDGSVGEPRWLNWTEEQKARWLNKHFPEAERG